MYNLSYLHCFWPVICVFSWNIKVNTSYLNLSIRLTEGWWSHFTLGIRTGLWNWKSCSKEYKEWNSSIVYSIFTSYFTIYPCWLVPTPSPSLSQLVLWLEFRFQSSWWRWFSFVLQQCFLYYGVDLNISWICLSSIRVDRCYQLSFFVYCPWLSFLIIHDSFCSLKTMRHWLCKYLAELNLLALVLMHIWSLCCSD